MRDLSNPYVLDVLSCDTVNIKELGGIATVNLNNGHARVDKYVGVQP